jgi:hypothetical protein
MTYLKQINDNDPERFIIIRESDNANIPAEPNNVDYQLFLAWVEEGNEPEIWEPEQ